MPGRGPAPKEARTTRHKPIRGDWQPSPGIGWQHGEIPEHPGALLPVTIEVWRTWMRSWFASNWTPDDLPGLAIVIQTYDQCQAYFADPYTERETRKGDTIYVLKPNPTPELRQLMDNYGITPKGQQDRRWVRPKVVETETTTNTENPYTELRVVG